MEKNGLFKKLSWAISLGFGALAILFFFAPLLNVRVKHGDGTSEYFDQTILQLLDPSKGKPWILIAAMVQIGLAMIAILVFFILKKTGVDKKYTNAFATASAFLYALSFAYMFALKEIFDYFAWDFFVDYKSTSMAWGLAVSIACAALGSTFAIVSSDGLKDSGVRGLAEDGVLVALAFVFSFIKIPIAANGGSINFQMLPLMIIALRRGPLHGFVAGGLVYGLLTCLTDGYGFATYPFDYLIGFGSVAVMGFFRGLIFSPTQKNYNVKGEVFLIVSAILATFIRFVGGTISSMVIYSFEFVPALDYNAVYITVSGAIAVGVIAALYGPLAMLNARFPAEKKGLKESAEEE